MSEKIPRISFRSHHLGDLVALANVYKEQFSELWKFIQNEKDLVEFLTSKRTGLLIEWIKAEEDEYNLDRLSVIYHAFLRDLYNNYNSLTLIFPKLKFISPDVIRDARDSLCIFRSESVLFNRAMFDFSNEDVSDILSRAGINIKELEEAVFNKFEEAREVVEYVLSFLSNSRYE